VSAAKNEDVGSLCKKWRSVFPDRVLDFGPRENSCFHQFDKLGAGGRDDAQVFGVGVDEAMKFLSCEGGFGGENADHSRLGYLRGRFDGGLHPDKRNGIACA